LIDNSSKSGQAKPSFFHHQNQELTFYLKQIIAIPELINPFLFYRQEPETPCHVPLELVKDDLI